MSYSGLTSDEFTGTLKYNVKHNRATEFSHNNQTDPYHEDLLPCE